MKYARLRWMALCLCVICSTSMLGMSWMQRVRHNGNVLKNRTALMLKRLSTKVPSIRIGALITLGNYYINNEEGIDSVDRLNKHVFRPSLLHSLKENAASGALSFLSGLYMDDNVWVERRERPERQGRYKRRYWSKNPEMWFVDKAREYHEITNDPQEDFEREVLPHIHFDKMRAFKNVLATVGTDCIWYGIKFLLWRQANLRRIRTLCERLRFLPGRQGQMLFYGIPLLFTLLETIPRVIIRQGLLSNMKIVRTARARGPLEAVRQEIMRVRAKFNRWWDPPEQGGQAAG